MIALTLIAYNLGLWFGEALRDVTYGHIKPSQVQLCLVGKLKVDLKKYPKWAIYSGLFVLLKQKLRISKNELRLLTQQAEKAFAILIFGNVRTCVRT